MENAPSLAPRHAGAPQTIVITMIWGGPGGVRSDRKSQKQPKIDFSQLLAYFPVRINKIEKFD